MDKSAGIALGRLVLALDQTVATLVSSPRGLDAPVSTVAMVDADDVHYGLGHAARSADLFLLVGLGDDVVVEWLGGLGAHRPVAVLAKNPAQTLVGLADRLGIAVIAIDPHARWERIYNLVTRVLDAARGAVGSGESMESGSTGDLFELAGEVARRTGGLVSIEDEHAHVLAYSSAGEEADELRRLSILGREGPPEMLAWLREWGVMDAVRKSSGVVMVEARTDLGLRPRRAVAIRPASGAHGDRYAVLLGRLAAGGVAPAGPRHRRGTRRRRSCCGPGDLATAFGRLRPRSAGPATPRCRRSPGRHRPPRRPARHRADRHGDGRGVHGPRRHPRRAGLGTHAARQRFQSAVGHGHDR